MLPNWFIALPLRGGEWLEEIRRTAPREVRVFHPDDVHITIAFLGAQPPGTHPVETMIKAMQSLVIPPCNCTFSRLRALPSPERMSAISWELDKGKSEISTIIRQHRAGLLQAASARPDNRPPLPHVTVARPRRQDGIRAIQAAAAWLPTVPPPTGEFLVTGIALYGWAKDRTQRQFDILYEQPL